MDSDLANGSELSEAQKLQRLHAASHYHPVTVEDEQDETVGLPSGGAAPARAESSTARAQPVSEKSAGKQKESAKQSAPLDTQSQELFPKLGAVKPPAAQNPSVWTAKLGGLGLNGQANGAGTTNGVSRTSTPPSGTATPTSKPQGGPPPVTLPGRNQQGQVFDVPRKHILPDTQLKRKIPDLVKDINRRSRARLDFQPLEGRDSVRFVAVGPQEAGQQALKDLLQQILAKTTITVPVPQSARSHIIGKQGSTIKSLQEKTGARIQLPKADENQGPVDDDDDRTVDVTIEGNYHTVEAARREILKIAGERASSVSHKLRNVPPHLYPFIAGAQNSRASAMEESHGVQIRFPPHDVWSSQPLPSVPAPGQGLVFPAANPDVHIQVVGDRPAVQAARAEIEQLASLFQEQLRLHTVPIEQGRHQFIVGDRGLSMDDFFSQTGCVVLLPPGQEDEQVTLLGPAARLAEAEAKALELAMQWQLSNIVLSRHNPMHVMNVTRYLRQRAEIERLEAAYQTRINTPFSEAGTNLWELYSRDPKTATMARTEINGVFNGHPPQRILTMNVDDFFYPHLRNGVSKQLRQDYGVQIVVPTAADGGAPVLLVYEGPDTAESPYTIPKTQPSSEEIKIFQQGLRDAERRILQLIEKQGEIIKTSIDVPEKFHDKLRKFIRNEQNSLGPDEVHVRVSSNKSTINLRGPSTAVESLTAKIFAFVEQEKAEEKERGYTQTFDFPPDQARRLIGRQGGFIGELREKFDVEIQVQDGKVELKGPKAKVDRARDHIVSLGRQWADETTYTIKVDPKYHRELIGTQGATVQKLETRHKVKILFPRTAKAAKEDQSVADTASEAGRPRRNQEPDEIVIRGPKRGADEARSEILDLVNYARETSNTATVVVQEKQLPRLIGQRGAYIEEIRRDTGAKIDIPDKSGVADGVVEIKLKGTKAQVAQAKKILEEKKAILDDTVVREIEVNKKHHRALIGASGANIRDIMVRAGVPDGSRDISRTVQFPKQGSDSDIIRLEGRKDVVDKIAAAILEIVAQRESQITETIDVPTDKHRGLIGRGGDAKRALESKFQVTIDIPRQGDGKTGVKISGQPEDVKKAVAHIRTLIQEQEGETMQIPRAFHHAVSNKGQLFKTLRQNFQVTVDHAGQTPPPKPSADAAPRANLGSLPLITDEPDTAADAFSWTIVSTTSNEQGDIPWVLKGPADGIARAKKAVETALEEAKKQDTTGYLVLPDPKTYRYVIGQGGRTVNSIRRQSGCKIDVPRDQARDQPIEITGTKEGVEMAKELILAAVREGQSGRGRRGE